MAKPGGIKPIGGKKKVKMLIYGIGGAGKTRLIGSTPGRTLIIRPPTDHTTSIDNKMPGAVIEEWEVDNWSTMNEVLEFCRHEGGRHYDWIWVDSVSLLQDHLIDDVWEDTIARKPERAKYGMDKSEYGINMSRLSKWCRDFIAVDSVNLGLTCHPFETTVEGGGEFGVVEEGDPIIMPWIQGRNMSMKFCGYMNAVFYLRVTLAGKKNVRELITDILPREHGAAIYGKNQLFPGETLINPTMKNIIDRIDGSGRANMARKPAVKRPVRRVVKRSK